MPKTEAWSPHRIGAAGGTLEFIEIVNVKFATNLPAKMVAAAAAFGVGASVPNGRNVPFELRNPNAPLALHPHVRHIGERRTDWRQSQPR